MPHGPAPELARRRSQDEAGVFRGRIGEHCSQEDVSHTIESGMQTYKGLPAPIVCDYLSREASRQFYAPGTEFQIGRIDMVANTGTYVDSPFHRYAEGKDLSQLALSSLANLACLVARIEPSNARAIDRLPFSATDVRGKAILIHTGWDRHWRSDAYFEGFPYLTGRLAQWLRDAGVAIVGIDSHNIDRTDTGERPVHSTLLGADIPIVEHLCGLGEVPEHGARFFAVPVKVKGFGTFPVRAFAAVEA
jgi:arylformamidase